LTNYCKFYNWKVVTDATLQVKHKTYRTNYNKTARYKRVLHFGIRFIITAIASAKLALMKKPFFWTTSVLESEKLPELL
jgi:hypothetical protein